MICKVFGCANPEYTFHGHPRSGFCSMHEQRNTRHGSPLVVVCKHCGKPFEYGPEKSVNAMCPSCFNSIRCWSCDLPVIGTERRRKRPWCGMCPRIDECVRCGKRIVHGTKRCRRCQRRYEVYG